MCSSHGVDRDSEVTVILISERRPTILRERQFLRGGFVLEHHSDPVDAPLHCGWVFKRLAFIAKRDWADPEATRSNIKTSASREYGKVGYS